MNSMKQMLEQREVRRKKTIALIELNAQVKQIPIVQFKCEKDFKSAYTASKQYIGIKISEKKDGDWLIMDNDYEPHLMSGNNVKNHFSF